MSQERFSSLRGHIPTNMLPKGANGFPLCRWCNEETPSRRRSFCSDSCVHEHRIRTDAGYIRQCLFRRDKGVCRSCELDTEALRQRCLEVAKWKGMAAPRKRKKINELLEAEDFKPLPDRRFSKKLLTKGRFWQGDHIQAVRDGGGLCGLEGYQTLCSPCHVRKSRGELRRRKATGL